MAEQWRVVPNCPEHIVSDVGLVRHRRVNSPLLKGYIDADGYRRVRINGREWRVHRLVCEAFHGPQPEGCEVAHLNGNASDNHADNLKWATHRENVAHAIAHGTHNRDTTAAVAASIAKDRSGERNPAARYSDATVAEVLDLVREGLSQRAVAARLNMSQPHVSRIVSGKRRNPTAFSQSSIDYRKGEL